MGCQRQQQLIHSYLDGELDVVRSLEFDQHFADCGLCEQDYRNQTALRSSLREDSLYYRAPDRLKERIQFSLRMEARPKVSQRIFSWPGIMVAASLALVLLGGLIGWRFMLKYPNLSGDDLLAQEVIADHVRSLQLPSHLTDVLSSDQHTVKPWFNGKVDFAPLVKDFASQEFRLYGGRLEYLNNRAVATLVYQRRLHYINLFIWPAQEPGTTGEVRTQRLDYNLIHWTSSGINYWAISDLSDVELHEFVRLVQQGQ